MRVTLQEPYETARGVLSAQGEMYARVINGQVIVQRRPRVSSKKQKDLRRKFGELWKGKHTAR